MVEYYELIEHTNSSDEEEDVLSITSTEVEKKKVISVLITSEANQGYLRAYVERQKILEHLTGKATIENFLEIPVDAELDIGQTFKLTLQNKTAGTNAEVYGLVKYEIVR